MKFIKYLIISNLLFWGIQFSLLGQKSDQAIKFGVGVHGLIPQVNSNSFELGFGQEYQIWLEKNLTKKSSLNLDLFYQNISGYSFRKMEINERVLPDEYQSIMISTDLASLTYIGSRLNWSLQLKENSPWSIGAGIQASYLTDWKAQQQEIVQVTSSTPRISETSFSGGQDFTLVSNEYTPIDSSYFNRFDYGVIVHGSFKITNGFSLKASFYQGLQNVFARELFSDGQDYKVRFISLGLTIRLI